MKFDGSPRRHPGSTDPDHAALRAAAIDGAALCTIVGIDGSFSRRRGAQIAVLPEGSVIGDLADTCLERELATTAARVSSPQTLRYGRGSPMLDFRLPCGGGLDILIDPSPDRVAIRKSLDDLAGRMPTLLALATNPLLPSRHYVPSLRIDAYGQGPELDWLVRLSAAAAIDVKAMDMRHLSLGKLPGHVAPDRWTAVLLLFHDHEWEMPLLEHSLRGDAFYIGAQGGAKARAQRLHGLKRVGFADAQIKRIQSPVGATSGSRTPQALALSALSDIMSRYEKLHPHG